MARQFISPAPLAWFTIENLVQQVFWLILFIILAPILGPRPYGLFSIVMAFIGVGEFVLLEGMAEALITVDHLDQKHTSTANLCNGLIAVSQALAIAVLAPLIAYIYNDIEIRSLLWALIPLPVLSSLMATPVAILRRSMRFKRLAVRSIIALTVGGLIGVVLGIAGAGVWALVFQILTQRVCEFVILWLAVPSHLRFGWSREHFREMKPIAANVFASRIMAIAGGQIPRVVIGYDLGAAQLGLYTLATRVLDAIIQLAIVPRKIVGRVELRLLKPGSLPFDAAFRSMVLDVSMLCFPLILGTVILAPDMFAAWLGSRWRGGELPTQLVVLSGIPMTFFYCSSAGLMASKRSGFEAWVNMAQSLTLSATVILVAPFGLVLTCIALLVQPIALLPLPLYLLRLYSGMSTQTILLAPLAPLCGAALMAAMVYGARPLLHSLSLPEIPALLLLVGLGAAIYALFLQIFTPHQFKQLLTRLFVK
jgi:O-antigen/teichoic acid export membrane protein